MDVLRAAARPFEDLDELARLGISYDARLDALAVELRGCPALVLLALERELARRRAAAAPAPAEPEPPPSPSTGPASERETHDAIDLEFGEARPTCIEAEASSPPPASDAPVMADYVTATP